LSGAPIYGLEGIVSKRRASGYVSEAWRHWVKVKCDGWREANQFRHKLFEGLRKQEPDPRERDLKKKREELRRVLEWGARPNAGHRARVEKTQGDLGAGDRRFGGPLRLRVFAPILRDRRPALATGYRGENLGRRLKIIVVNAATSIQL
jgi:hypothetical protein